MRALAPATVALLLFVTGCAGRPEPQTGPGFEERGVASWYGPGFDGRLTANGEVYDMHAMTAAHKTLAFDSLVRVHNLDNGRSIEVRINDRGPFVRGRIIDLSRAGAEAIGMLGPGTARVKIRVVGSAARAASYLVQAGAFREADRANDLARRLRGDFPTADVRSNDGWSRVVVGPYDERSKADDAARRLRRRGFEAVVREIE